MEDIIEKFNILTAKPAKYLEVQNDIKDDIKQLIKTLYDFTKSQEEKDKNIKNSALPHLLIDDFDEEQIWQQIELQNSQRWDQLVWEVANCMSDKNDLIFPVSIPDEDETEPMDGVHSEDEISSKNLVLEEVVSPKDNKKKKTFKKRMDSTKKSKLKESIVDDEFFKLKDMETFLLKEEKNEYKTKDDSDEESVDMFNDIDDQASDDEEGNEKDMMYSDFFNGERVDGEEDEDGEEEGDHDEIDDNDTQEEEKSKKSKKSDKRVRFAEETSEESSSEDNNKAVVDKPVNNMSSEEKKSEFEKRQQRLQQQISKLEEKTLNEAPWQLKGEVDGTKRPQNSLLEEVVDFDLTTRPPPIITEQTTITLEEIIMRRVKDKAWDDVEKKEKPVDDQLAFRKPEVLDHAKSKLSLAQVYEAEYLKQKQALSNDNEDEKEPEVHKEIRDAMKKLFTKLDALCHYHYTPKPPQVDVKIVSNTPAISMEEVAPVATSDAALLAPEEVKKKRKGDLMSKEERTETDKKRERRKKKKLQKLKGKVMKVTEQRNTKKGVEANDKSLKTSKAFFQQLNDESSSLIKLKTKHKNKGQ